MHYLRCVMVFRVLGRGFCLFVLVCYLGFVGRAIWLVCRLAVFWKYKVENGVLMAYQRMLGT
jgi:hypothetical protein